MEKFYTFYIFMHQMCFECATEQIYRKNISNVIESCLGPETDLKRLKYMHIFEYVGYTCSFTGGSSQMQSMKDN